MHRRAAGLKGESRSSKLRAELFRKYVLRPLPPPPTDAHRHEAAERTLHELREGNSLKESMQYFSPKLIEISTPSEPQIQSVLVPPSLEELREKLLQAKFAGKGDHEKVMEMLDDFDRLMSGRLTKAQAQKRYGWAWKVLEKLRPMRTVLEPLMASLLRREHTYSKSLSEFVPAARLKATFGIAARLKPGPKTACTKGKAEGKGERTTP